VTPDEGAAPPPLLDFATHYTMQGRCCTPLRGKAAFRPGWQRERLEVPDLPEAFSNGAHATGVGVLTGAPSRNLADADLDSPEALALADQFLPPTSSRFGRPSRPGTHRLYTAPGVGPVVKFAADPSNERKSMLVELRGTGGQTAFPPSAHSGERVAWESLGEPAVVPWPALLWAVRLLAVASLLARSWPRVEGTRHDLALAVAGFLARRGLTEDEAARIIGAAARYAGDAEAVERVADVRSTFAAHAAGTATTGGPTVASLLGEPAFKALEKFLPHDEQERPQQRESTPRWVRLSTVVRERVTWLWRPYIPYGRLGILDGDPGVGKSTVLLDLAARLTTGRPMPSGGGGCTPAGVVVLSAEDTPGDTIRPRLEAHGADLERVGVFPLDLDLVLPGALVEVEEAALALLAGLIIVDPLVAYVDTKVNTHHDQQIRGVLRQLAALATRTGAAVLAIRHLTKVPGGAAIYRGGGSIGIAGAARTVTLVAEDPDDAARRVYAPVKNNLAAKGKPLAFAFEAIDADDARIVWQGESTHTAESLTRPPDPEEHPGDVERAVETLRELLSEGAVEARVAAKARVAHGHSVRVWDKAAKRLRVIKFREGFQGTCKWKLPPDSSTSGAGGRAGRGERFS
jgi:AAA domain-containing protein/bifunctional DNA primase/polymerase-like protein